MRRLISAVAATLCLAASPAVAQSRIQIGVGGGLTQPTGDFGDASKMGWHGRATVAVLPASGPVGFRALGMYGKNDFDPSGGDTKLAGGLAQILVGLRNSGQIKPYAVVGGGIMNVKVEPDVGSSASETKGALGFGVGITYEPSPRTGLFFEANWLNVFTSGSDLTAIPLSVGVQFSLGGS